MQAQFHNYYYYIIIILMLKIIHLQVALKSCRHFLLLKKIDCLTTVLVPTIIVIIVCQALGSLP